MDLLPDSSIVIISLPAIFRGIHLDPWPENVGYLLWMLMGYLVATCWSSRSAGWGTSSAG